MNMKLLRILTILLVFAMFGCNKSTSTIILKEFGPTHTKAGEVFNIQQPQGLAAVWVKSENATETTKVVWENTKLVSYCHNPQYLTAFVPKELYSKRGTYQVYLLDIKTGAKSNSLAFIVE